MARGLGTALGVTVAALTLRSATWSGHASAGPAAAMAALAMCAPASARARRRTGAGDKDRTVRAGGHDTAAVPR